MDYDISIYDKPSVAVDAVVFGIEDTKSATMDEKKLKILLIKRGEEPFTDMYSLPGGFLRRGETVEEAVRRELAEEAGVTHSKLIPLKVYSKTGRDPRGWIISDAFISLTNTVELSTLENSDAKEAVWLDLTYSPDNDTIRIADDIIISADGFVLGSTLAFDHGQIIYDAFRKLQDEVRYHDIIFDLMPELFTISDLYNPYKTILSKSETIQAFRKRMMPKIEETEFYDNTSWAHRKSRLYRRKEK